MGFVYSMDGVLRSRLPLESTTEPLIRSIFFPPQNRSPYKNRSHTTNQSALYIVAVAPIPSLLCFALQLLLFRSDFYLFSQPVVWQPKGKKKRKKPDPSSYTVLEQKLAM